MCAAFLGVDKFNEGITAYLKKYSYDNAEQNQLWAELDVVAEFEDTTLKIADIMDTWTKQMGYPVINIERNGNALKASQVNHFLTNK
jgi:aminopeptidase N